MTQSMVHHLAMTAHRYHSTGKGQSATTWSCGSSSLRVDPTAKANTPSRKVSTRIVSGVTIAQHVHSYVHADDDIIAKIRKQNAYINGVPVWGVGQHSTTPCSIQTDNISPQVNKLRLQMLSHLALVATLAALVSYTTAAPVHGLEARQSTPLGEARQIRWLKTTPEEPGQAGPGEKCLQVNSPGFSSRSIGM
jgi:hypothetical protein